MGKLKMDKYKDMKITIEVIGEVESDLIEGVKLVLQRINEGYLGGEEKLDRLEYYYEIEP